MPWSMICSAFSNFTVAAMSQGEDTEARRNSGSRAQIQGKAEPGLESRAGGLQSPHLLC